MEKLRIYSFALMLLVGQVFAVHHAIEHHIQAENIVSEQGVADDNTPTQPAYHSKDCGLCHFAEQAFDTSGNALVSTVIATDTAQLSQLDTVIIPAEFLPWQSRAPPAFA